MRLAGLASLLAAVACHGAPVIMEPATAVPESWATTGPSAPHSLVELTFAVKQQNVRELHEVLMRVSDPRSPSYGQHLSNEEVHRLTAPKPAHVAEVLNYLKQHGSEGQLATQSGDHITATVPIAVAEKLLSARYVQLLHNFSGVVVDRAVGGYQLPETVAAAVDFVAPAAHIPDIKKPVWGSGQDVNVPKSLRQLYGVGDAEGKAGANKQAVTAFLHEFYNQSALKEFWQKYCSGITCGKGLPKLVGDATTGSPGTEAMLDIESITGVAGNIESEFWGFTTPKHADEPFVKWLTKLHNTSDADVPKVFSTSYGGDESTWPKPAATRLNHEFMKAGARGISLLFASGDFGAGCLGGKFHAMMPASSPYVTAVGGTQPASGFPSPGSESAIGLSAGGFSNFFPTPDWQKEAVASYLKQPGLPNKSMGYNVTGRGFPDIAAQATNFCVTTDWTSCNVQGTSCSSPTAAGVISLLNDLRLQSGKSTLGFLNPLLYQNADAMYDVTTGSSDGCGVPGGGRPGGWPATKGWDAVTGLGTPNYGKLAKVVAALPGPPPAWQRGATIAV